MIDSYRLLLEKAALSFDRHEAGRGESFNVFTVLRSAHDEVNLHSRFLTALLDHRQGPGKERENLKDFLSRFHIGGIDHNDAAVEREADNIDILIRDRTARRAIVIENKIYAPDQPRQLERYSEQMRTESYNASILYLTLDGSDASVESAGNLEYRRLSYRDDIAPWLKCCQKRAYDEPALRESVGQYLRLIAKLTGTDASETYMTELKNLCLDKDSDGRSNLLAVHDLQNAAAAARVDLLVGLWEEIRRKANMSGLPEPSGERTNISRQTIEDFVYVRRGRKNYGLCYKINDKAHLEIWQDRYRIYVGIYCNRNENPGDYDKFANCFQGGQKDGDYPWYQYFRTDLNWRDPSCEALRVLTDDTERRKYVDELVARASRAWNEIKRAGIGTPDPQPRNGGKPA